VNGVRKIFSSGLGGAVGEEQAVIVAEHRVADRGLDADSGGAADDDEMFDPLFLQDLMEVRFVETTVTGFVNDCVAGKRSKLVDDVGIPCVANKNSARASVWCVRHVSDAQVRFGMFDPTGRVGKTGIRQIVVISHLEIDGGNSCASCCFENSSYRLNYGANR